MRTHSLVFLSGLLVLTSVGCSGLRPEYQVAEKEMMKLSPEKRMAIDVALPNFEQSGTKLLRSEPFQCDVNVPTHVKHYFMIEKPLQRTFFSLGSPDKITIIFEHDHGRPLHAWIDTDGDDSKAESYWEGTSVPGYPDMCKMLEWTRKPELAHYHTSDELKAKLDARRNRRPGNGGVAGLPAQMLNTLKGQGLVAN